MRIAQEEIFGPDLVVIPYDDLDDAVNIANDSVHGLAGAVFTIDFDRAVAVAQRIRVGTFTVNGFGQDPSIPFGGFKQSGLGRGGGPEGLAAYLETQTLFTPGRSLSTTAQ
jgi:aldehyde dehydrogenase (NAD+)